MGRRWAVVLVLFLGAALGAFATYWFLPRPQGNSLAEVRQTPLPVQSAADTEMGSGLIAEAAARIAPAVVTINTEYRPRTSTAEETSSASVEVRWSFRAAQAQGLLSMRMVRL